MAYVFPGLTPYIHAAARDAGLLLKHEGRDLGLWHVGQIQTALGQIPTMAAIGRELALSHATTVRQDLALVLEAIDRAIAEVSEECGLPHAKPKRKGFADGLYATDHGRERPDLGAA